MTVELCQHALGAKYYDTIIPVAEGPVKAGKYTLNLPVHSAPSQNPSVTRGDVCTVKAAACQTEPADKPIIALPSIHCLFVC